MHGMTVIAQACRPLKVASILRVQGANIPQMLDYAHHAEELNADAVVAMPPSCPQMQTEEGYHAYFAALAGVVRRPVVFQTSIPGFRGAMIPPVDLILRPAREFPNVAYVKEESASLVARMKEEVKHRDLLKGVFGAYGDVMVAVFNLYREGHKDEAADAFAKWL